jgi:NAD(P)-dependent dehydrogenase (short-subunit alcohol dehydrogenase family)
MGLACARRLTTLVDVLLLVDRDESSVAAAAEELAASGGCAVEPVALDVTDRPGLDRLAAQVAERGALRAVAHAAGISPTMADWQRIFAVDLVGTALLVDALRPTITAGTAIVCFASMAPMIGISEPNPAADAAIDAPLADDLLDRVRDALGPAVESSGIAYPWAKRGVHRFVQTEAVRLGRVGARICSVSPGLIDTPQGQQEAANHPSMQRLLEATPLGRLGQADDVAAAVAFLLSDAAGFISGIDVLVDGGVVAAVRGARGAA